ncbi:MAG: peptidase S41 [Planctomycetota bacterium]|nr:MAG: peptidase S41 [Planctomycetota bacterium]
MKLSRRPLSLCLCLILLTSLTTLPGGDASLWADSHEKPTAKDWMRYPAISPDGKQIAFSFRGDLWLVDAAGGRARHLTTHDLYERSPVWSPDGKQIAFASDRHGNFDVFLMSASGGKAQRLTYHSAADTPTAFTPDGKEILFTSYRLDAPQAVIGTRRMGELYKIGVEGGRPRQVLTTTAEYANYNPDSTKLLFHDYKGTEDPWRKHHTSSITRDVWTVDAETGKYTRLTSYEGEDRNPVWNADGSRFYYLSEEKSGSFNVWTMDPANPDGRTQVTEHETHPVRFLTVADDGTLCYGYNGEIWTKRPGQEPKQVEIEALADERSNDYTYNTRSGGASYMAVSPNEEEIAFILRGEVYVTSVEFDTTRRITSTPEQERTVTWGKDNRTLYYDGERNGSWNLYQAVIALEDDDSFANAAIVTETPLLETADETFQPVASPDGKKLAYLKNRYEIMVLDLETKKSQSLIPARKNHSYADGDISYAWSPDSRWLTATYHGHRIWTPEVAAVKLATGDIVNVTESGYAEGGPMFSSNGKVLLYVSSRYGLRAHGGFGGAQGDIFGLYLNQDAYDEAVLSKAELALKKKREKKRKEKEKDKDKKKDSEAAPVAETDESTVPQKATPDDAGAPPAEGDHHEDDEDEDDEDEDDEKDDEDEDDEKDDDEKDDDEDDEDDEDDDEKRDKDDKDEKDKDKVEPIKFELEDRENRLRRLTLMSASIGGYDLSPDGEHLLYAAKIDDKWSLWVVKLRDRSTTKAMSLGGWTGHIEFTKDGKSAFMLQGGSIKKLSVGGALGGGSASAKPVTFRAEQEIDEDRERAYIFEHIWRQTLRKFYDPEMHGVDWAAMKANYEQFLPTITNNYDFRELLSEMLGELNASHTGARYFGRHGTGDATASLGMLYDVEHDGVGLKIAEIIKRGPADRADSEIRAGHIITHIDGDQLAVDVNPWRLLNRKSGKPVRLTLHDPVKDREYHEIIRPTSQSGEANLLYERWIETRRELCEKVSGGKIGYVHVRGMDDASFRRVYSEVLGRNNDKQALIVDTRYNGGGWLHERLTTFLDGELYCYFLPRGHQRGDLGGEPIDKWTKPVAVVQNEGNYSDAHFFPWAFKTKKIGKLVGAPVPGTSTAVWWEGQIDPSLVFGIPQVGITTLDGRYLENFQLEPDVLVLNDAESMAAGEDKQLVKAVEVLLEETQAEKK